MRTDHCVPEPEADPCLVGAAEQAVAIARVSWTSRPVEAPTFHDSDFRPIIRTAAMANNSGNTGWAQLRQQARSLESQVSADMLFVCP